MGEGRWELVAGVVGAILDVAPKGLGFVGVGVPKGLEELVGCMWGYSGRLGSLGIEWGMSRSNEVVVRAATRFMGRPSRLIVVSVIDGLRRLGASALIKLLFLLFNEGAVARPMTLVSAMDAAVWYFLPSDRVFSAATVGVASVAPPSSVVLRPGVAGFVIGDRVHGLWVLCLFSLMWLRSIAIARSLHIHLFDSPTLTLV